MSSSSILPAATHCIEAALRVHFASLPDLSKASMKRTRKFVEKHLKVDMSSREQKAALKEIIHEVAGRIMEERAEASEAAEAAKAITEARVAVEPVNPSTKAVRAKPSKGRVPKRAPEPMTDAEAREAAKKKSLLKLGPDLSAMCGGTTVSIRPLLVKKVWAYVKEQGLQGQGKTIRLDATMRRAAGDLVSPDDTVVSTGFIMKVVGKQVSPWEGEPPEEVVEYVKAKGKRPATAAKGTKRAREPSAAEAAGLPTDFKLLKKPRKLRVLQMSEILKAAVMPERAQLGLVTRSKALQWVWEYIKAHDLQGQGGLLKASPELVALLGPPDDSGGLHQTLIMKKIGEHLLDYDGPSPDWLHAEWQAQVDAFEGQQDMLRAQGIDPRSLGKAAKRSQGSGQGALADKMFALDDALTALVGFRIASHHVLVQGARSYIVQQGLSADPDTQAFIPDAVVQAVVGHKNPMLLKELGAHLNGRLTPVPTSWKEGVQQGVVNLQDFIGTRYEKRVRAALEGEGAESDEGSGDEGDGGGAREDGLSKADAAALEAAGQA